MGETNGARLRWRTALAAEVAAVPALPTSRRPVPVTPDLTPFDPRIPQVASGRGTRSAPG